MDTYKDPHLGVDFTRKTAWLDSRQMSLTRKEFELLAALVRHAGEVVHRGLLLKDVWGYNPEVRTRTLDVHIRRLRKKMGSLSDTYIETIFGVGYRFEPFRPARSPETRLPPDYLELSA